MAGEDVLRSATVDPVDRAAQMLVHAAEVRTRGVIGPEDRDYNQDEADRLAGRALALTTNLDVHDPLPSGSWVDEARRRAEEITTQREAQARAESEAKFL